MANKYTKIIAPPKKEIVKLYHQKEMTFKELSDFYLVSIKVIQRWFKELKIKARKAKKRNQKEDKNDNWKGNNAGYAAFHKRVEAKYGKPKICVVCKTKSPDKRYEWANLTGKFNDLNDYQRMCCACHRKFDSYNRRKNRKER